MEKCKRCADKECGLAGVDDGEFCADYKPQTNADCIRSMTDEELAEFMCHNVSNGTVNCAFCGAAEFCRMGHNGWLGWLKQEVSANDS